MSATIAGVTLELVPVDDCVETRLWVGEQWIRVQKSANMMVARARTTVLRSVFSGAFCDVAVAVVERDSPAEPQDDHPRMF